MSKSELARAGYLLVIALALFFGRVGVGQGKTKIPPVEDLRLSVYALEVLLVFAQNEPDLELGPGEDRSIYQTGVQIHAAVGVHPDKLGRVVKIRTLEILSLLTRLTG